MLQIYVVFSKIETINLNNMDEDNKNSELDNTAKKLHISDVSGRYSLEEAKKFSMEKFNSDEMMNKYPSGGWVKIDDILKVLEVGVECGYKFGQKSKD